MEARLKANVYSDTLSSSFLDGVSAVFKKGDFSFLNDPRYTVLPGFCDVHVHFREPGFSYKETIATGSAAAARGGYTAVCTMPNLNPVPDNLDKLRPQLERIAQAASIGVYPYGAITVGQQGTALAELAELAPYVIAFSDDGRGVQNEELMRGAMLCAKELGKLVVAHCEDNSLLRGGYIHDGAYARTHGHKGICSESEWKPIERDLKLAEETGCAYHVCHISTKESVALIRQAKARGVNVTCETAPHYLLMDDSDLQEDGAFKMNPPLRDKSDREALLEGLLDGTIDMIATDHAPHSAAEKSKGLAGSAFGIVGLETAFPLLHTYMVQKGIITPERLLELLVFNPRRRFGIPLGNDFSVWDLERQYPIDPTDFLSLGHATPFRGWQVSGRCVATFYHGSLIEQTLSANQGGNENG